MASALGITGTRWLVDSEVYPEKFAGAWPATTSGRAPTERDEINRIIIDELVCGEFTPAVVAYFQQVIGA